MTGRRRREGSASSAGSASTGSASTDRGRVPFAVIGVLLLLGSTTYAASLGVPAPVREDDSAATAAERLETALCPAVRTAVREAARDAARDPVTRPANTSPGRALNASTPFRDALRLRIAVGVRDRLDALAVRRGDAVAVGALGLPGSTATRGAANPGERDGNLTEALRRAKRGVRLRGVDDGTAVRVTVRDLDVVVRRDGRVVERYDHPVTVTVAVPVLAMHDRTERYERRLNRRPLDGPGLGRRLTARLYPVVWARSYAQYGGVPVQNVLANRHVELLTNGAALDAQRAAFGRGDPAGRRRLAVATARVGLTDLLAPTDSGATEWTSTVLRTNAATEPGPPSAPSSSTDAAGGVDPAEPLRVGVNATADEAFVAVVESGALADARRSAYRVEAALDATVETVRRDRAPRPRSPGPNWSLVDERRSREVEVVERQAVAPTPTDRVDTSVDRTDDGRTRAVVRRVRTVRVRQAVVRVWTDGNRTRRHRRTWVARHRVTLRVDCRYAPRGPAPDRLTRPLFVRGGALDGPNLVDVPGRAIESLVADRGGADRLAVRAVRGDDVSARTVLVGDRPESLRTRTYADVAGLRDRVRNVSTTVSRGAVAAGAANAPARLAGTLRDRRVGLVDAPPTYRGAAARARAAARAAYLDAVLRKLDRRAGRSRERNGALDDLLRERGVGGVDAVDRVRRTRRDVPPGRRGRVGTDGPGAPVALVPDGAPTYLTLSGVTHTQVAAVPPGRTDHPLVARNTNLFAVPTGDATDTVVDAALGDGGGRVPLATGGRALVAAERTLAARENATLRGHRNRLRAAVDASLNGVGGRTRRVLARETSLSAPARRATVEAAFSRWDGPGRRALAVSNGSFARAVAAAAAAREPRTARGRDWLAVRVRTAVGEEAQNARVRVPAEATNRTVTATRRVRRQLLARAVETGASRAVDELRNRTVGDAFGGVLAGLPVAPVPGYWYATTNVWTVSVRGSYRRFAVRAPVGPPNGAGGGVRYVRDGGTARLDVDADGDPERLGVGERVSFETGTVVVVAVPPGRGVGDVDGDADERSAGWPCPGPARAGDRCRGWVAVDG